MNLGEWYIGLGHVLVYLLAFMQQVCTDLASVIPANLKFFHHPVLFSFVITDILVFFRFLFVSEFSRYPFYIGLYPCFICFPAPLVFNLPDLVLTFVFLFLSA
jgi:hypothetical protein